MLRVIDILVHQHHNRTLKQEWLASQAGLALSSLRLSHGVVLDRAVRRGRVHCPLQGANGRCIQPSVAVVKEKDTTTVLVEQVPQRFVRLWRSLVVWPLGEIK